MADVYVNALTTLSSEPTSTDSIVCVNRNTNEGQIIDYSLLADVILSKISSKTYSSLTTTSKLLTGAINELDADVTSLNSRGATIEESIVSIAANDVVLSTFTTVKTLTRNTGYVHIIIVNVSFSTSSAGRYLITQTSGNNSECVVNTQASAASGLNVMAMNGNGTSGNIQYYFTVRPTTAVTFNIKQIKLPIAN